MTEAGANEGTMTKRKPLLFATDAIMAAVTLMSHAERVFRTADEPLRSPFSACVGEHAIEHEDPQYVRLCWSPSHSRDTTIAVWCSSSGYRVGELAGGPEAATEWRNGSDAAFALYTAMIEANARGRRARAG